MKKILVIEDEQALLDNILEMLRLEGFDASGAQNGQEGVRIARDYQPDLVVSDILMPTLDGYEVLQQLRGDPATAMIPFVFLTAKVDRQSMRFGMELGADDYLTKPFTSKELLGAINARLEKHAWMMRDIDRQTEDFEMLRRVDRELSSRLEAEWVIRIIMDWVLRRTHAQAAVLGLVELGGKTLKLHYAWSRGTKMQPRLGDIWPLEGIMGLLVQNRHPILLSNVTRESSLTPPHPDTASFLGVPLRTRGHVLGVIVLESEEQQAFSQNELVFLSQMADRAAIALQHSQLFQELLQQQQQEQELRALFGRFVSPEVAEAIRSGQVQLGGETRVVSILFCDIRSFTAYSEGHSPQEVVSLLNEYLPLVVNAAQTYGGTVNQFAGDSVLVIYGAPTVLQESAYRAILTALLMRNNLRHLNVRLSDRGIDPIRIGIGINTGAVVAGMIGSMERQEYTVIGDTVNLASRIEALNKQYPNHDIFISDYTYASLDHRQSEFELVDLGDLPIRGKASCVKVWSVKEFAARDQNTD